MTEHENAVPTLYKNEIIAFATGTEIPTSASLERFKDLGWSIGVINATWNEPEQSIDFNLNDLPNISPAYTALRKDKSKNFRIISINGEKVTESMLSKSGAFDCMERGKDYTLEYYAGTYYQTITINASMHILESWEIMNSKHIETTKNGYVEATLLDDLESGWYQVNGKGLFKYIAHEKDGSPEPTQQEWNKPYFKGNEGLDEQYAQKYSITFSTYTSDVRLVIEHDPYYGEEPIRSVAIAPDGQQYEFQNEDGKQVVAVTEAILGKWNIYVSPKELLVKNIKIESMKAEEEATEVTQEFVLAEADDNQMFIIEHTGEGTIFGSVITPQGQAVDFEYNSKMKRYECFMSYLTPGTYTARVYHYTDTDIINISMVKQSGDGEEDVITVTE